ncbi:MAG: chromosome segregation protein SMC [Propionibacterium sp.]
MYLKSLTLRGFKSFASATTLNFEPGITAIVGPNGSGKSNIVDALAWVMGEQGAKHLRGAKMEDVIFAGTSGRAPLGRAEVTLTIDNTDGALPIEYTEVTISRTLFRSGGSEYAINGRSVRLLDVQELLSDTGMGREMHVIVGQGQLEQILASSPEMRRGYIEEAAGVLKHRRRREKAVRKLESTGANLDRLTDLIAEIRRQLKPLGRQAALARKAGLVQAELRDAKARLLADELTTETLALDSERRAESAAAQLRARAQEEMERAQRSEQEAELAATQLAPALAAAQEHWVAASTLAERNRATASVSAERMRRGAGDAPRIPSRDPGELESQAAQVRDQERKLGDELDLARQRQELARAARDAAEKSHQQAEQEFAAQLRALADRREGRARLTGQLASLDSRLGAGKEETERLVRRRDEALLRAQEADASCLGLEGNITGLGAGESELDAHYERAQAAVRELEEDKGTLSGDGVEAQRRVSALHARLEALELGLESRDGSAGLLDAGIEGIGGALSTMVRVEPGWEAALAAALGPVAEALVADGTEAACQAVDDPRVRELGRVNVVIAGVVPETGGESSELPPGGESSELPRGGESSELPPGGRPLLDLVEVGPQLRGPLTHLLGGVVAVDDIVSAAAVVGTRPELRAVTRSGQLLSRWLAGGGGGEDRSAIELQAQVTRTREELAGAEHEAERIRFARQALDEKLTAATAQAARALEKLNESDAAMSALAEQLSHLGQTARTARAEAARLEEALDKARQRRGHDELERAAVRERMERAGQEDELDEPDPAQRDGTALEAGRCRQLETDARLAVRTAEERLRALSGRADSLLRAASQERSARAQEAARAERNRREQAVARAVHAATQWLAGEMDQVQQEAGREREQVDRARTDAENALSTARRRRRECADKVAELLADAHRGEVAHVEQRMRIEALTERAMTELGLAAEVLMSEYGPDTPVPVLAHPDGRPFEEDEERPRPVPFDREQQSRRLRSAQRTLDQLGRINPLALEEFEALNERHQFLAEQLADLKQTRKDLQAIIDEVDARVQQVFSQAYADVERTFADLFPRLFPGGEGRLVLTDPGDLSQTGVDIEARPAGKKVRRMSLLSGGERSLVSVAFLFALFIARPSPFYILDEVEAALDDVNLSRLLGIYEELRKDSQLLVITHQKRTMEKADALYGVTMRGDGVTTVISQRLAD